MHESPLLDSPRYRRFLAEAHPELGFSDERLEVPSYVAPLDVREPMMPGLLRHALALGAHLSPAHVTPPTLFLGSPFEPYEQTSLLDDVRAPAGLAARARAEAERAGLELVVVTCVAPEHPSLPAWLEAGFHALPSFPDTVVPLAGRTFDEHLGGLPAGDRSGIRRNLRRFQAAGHTLERCTSSRAHADALLVAYRPMFERASVKWLPHSRAYFGGVAELDERVHLTLARSPAGEVAGFVVAFEDLEGRGGRRTLHAGRLGVHPRFHRKDAVYFRLLYHVLEESLALRCTQLSLEPTSYRTKRHLGARRRPLVNLVLGVSPSWRLVLATLSGVGRRLLRHLEHGRTLEALY